MIEFAINRLYLQKEFTDYILILYILWYIFAFSKWQS